MKKLFLIIGAPGSGKTTDAQLIAQKNADTIVHYSTGDLLREEVASGSDQGKIIDSFISKGNLVPLDIVVQTIVTALQNAPKNIVIIDHHIKSKDYIKDATLTYINASLSSTVEFVTKYFKYLNKTVDPIIATFMLVGLEIDTNNFRLKTTKDTYEAASFLSQLGADNVLKQELLQENKDDYIRRQKLIENGEFLPSYMWNVNGWLCDKLGLTITSQTQKCIPTFCNHDITSSTLNMTVKAGDCTGMRAIVTTTTEEGITLETECIGKVYSEEDYDCNNWKVIGEPTTNLTIARPQTVELTCATIVNRIPDVLMAEPGFIPTSQMGELTKEL